MVESEAQGRLPGIAPVSVVDIGSNSIRLVVYEGMSRSPTILFNEKVLCGLGKGIAVTGKMDEESVGRALAALHRFKALSDQARAATMYVLATAAAREASNGPDFIHQAETILGRKVRVLSGEEEAKFASLGIISGFFNPDGIARRSRRRFAGTDRHQGQRGRQGHHLAARRPAPVGICPAARFPRPEPLPVNR